MATPGSVQGDYEKVPIHNVKIVVLVAYIAIREQPRMMFCEPCFHLRVSVIFGHVLNGSRKTKRQSLPVLEF